MDDEQIDNTSENDNLDNENSSAEDSIQKAEFEPLDASSNATSKSNLDINFLLDITLNLSIELGRTVMNVKDILALNDGSVVELDKLAGDPVDIFVNGKLIANGEVVVIDDNFGVRVTDILSPAELLNNLKSDEK